MYKDLIFNGGCTLLDIWSLSPLWVFVLFPIFCHYFAKQLTYVYHLHKPMDSSWSKSIHQTNIMASSPTISWQVVGGKVGTVADFLFLDSKITWMVIAAVNLKDVFPWNESYDKARWHIKMQKYHFANKGPYSQSYSFSCMQVRKQQLELDMEQQTGSK